MAGENKQDEQPYEVGYKKPPRDTQFKNGQRANPNGRPRGSPNMKNVVEKTLKKKIPVRRGDKTSKVTVLEAIADTFALKAAQGDAKAASVVITLATRSGVLSIPKDGAPSPTPQSNVTANNLSPSDKIIESVDPNLLSKDEQIELSQLAERVDRVGDVMALADADLLRLKLIVERGRLSVAPKYDEVLDEAA